MAAADRVASSQAIRTTLVAGMVGNVMEWYDFSLYATFAPVLARLFFPSSDQTASLLATFAVFAAGFGARPLGAVIFGHYGDRLGRTKALAASARRGFFSSWAMSGAYAGMVLGSALGALLAATLPAAALDLWGWRLPFLFGLVVGLVGLYIRLGIQEGPAFADLERAGAIANRPLVEAIRYYWRAIVTTIALLLLSVISEYMFLAYTPTYLTDVVGLPLAQALTVDMFGLLLLAVLVPIMGALSDRVGRKPILVAWAVGFVIFSYPIFVLMAHGSLATAVGGVVLFAGLLALGQGPISATLAEALPTRVRYTAVSVAYNVAQAGFGGTVPLVATYLVSVTGNHLTPSGTLIVAAIVTLLVVLRLPDRSHLPLA